MVKNKVLSENLCSSYAKEVHASKHFVAQGNLDEDFLVASGGVFDVYYREFRMMYCRRRFLG